MIPLEINHLCRMYMYYKTKINIDMPDMLAIYGNASMWRFLSLTG